MIDFGSCKLVCIAIVGLVTFIADAARGILFPALLPLSDTLGEHVYAACCRNLTGVAGGSKVILGFLVATFSLGRVVISTRLGIMADEKGHRYAMLVSGGIIVIGALLWANAVFLGGLAMLFIAQFTLGLGTASLGVTRAYVAEQTVADKRTYMLARLSALQYAGFSVTPLLGSVLVVAGESISEYAEYALPAYLLLFCALGTFALLWYVFVDHAPEEVVAGPKDLSLTGTSSKVHSYNEVNQDQGIEMRPVAEDIAKSTDTDVESQLSESSPCSPEGDATVNPLTQYETIEQDSSGEVKSTAVMTSDTDEERVRRRVYNITMFINFSSRGVISIMEHRHPMRCSTTMTSRSLHWVRLSRLPVCWARCSCCSSSRSGRSASTTTRSCWEGLCSYSYRKYSL